MSTFTLVILAAAGVVALVICAVLFSLIGAWVKALFNGAAVSMSKLVALKLASKAYEANKDAQGGGWQYQMLLAKAYAANKQYDKAVETQEQVIGKLPAQISAQVKEREEKVLADYKAKAGAGAATVK